MSERLKLSQFNVTIPLPKGKGTKGQCRGGVTHDNVLLVYNTLTRALVSLSKESYEPLENISTPVKPEISESVETLKKQGILVKANEDESQKAQRWYDRIRFDKSCMRLSVLTTYNCNFACVYCIENGVKKPVKMDDTYSSLTFDWIKERAISQGVSNLFVLFYGGEPLLCKLRITNYELRIVKSSCPLDLRNPKCKVYYSKLHKYKADLLSCGKPASLYARTFYSLSICHHDKRLSTHRRDY